MANEKIINGISQDLLITFPFSFSVFDPQLSVLPLIVPRLTPPPGILYKSKDSKLKKGDKNFLNQESDFSFNGFFPNRCQQR